MQVHSAVPGFGIFSFCCKMERMCVYTHAHIYTDTYTNGNRIFFFLNIKLKSSTK